jgi:hypothetical protein
VPYGPEVSWPGGYPNPEYRGGDYRPARPALPASQNHGEHPYAAYDVAGYGDNGTGYAHPTPDTFGYGDPGYTNPGYDGPSAQDAGIAGTRTVRGFVEPGQRGSGYHGGSGHQPYAALPAAGTDYSAAGYGQPTGYSQPWDYDQPLRYDGEDPTYLGTPSGQTPSGGYPTRDGYGSTTSHGSPGYGRGYGNSGYESGAYKTPAYDPAAYNGSELSRPGVDGPGYDLSEIIGTADFPSFGYDEPSVQRLAYDDPRYDDGSRGSRYDDRPRFDETRLDSFWRGDGHPSGDFPTVRDGGEGGGVGRGRSDHRNPGGRRSLSGAGAGYGERRVSNETRLDLGYRADETSFDVPAYGRYDDTRMDDMRALSSARGRAATGLLAPERPLTWTDDTSLDSFAGLDLDELPTLREEPSRAVATALREAPPVREDTGSQRATGRRRGRSSDRRQWVALGAVAVVAVGAITGVLSKFVFAGPSGPAHTISTPAQLDSYTQSPSLEKAANLSAIREQVIQGSSGQASDVISAVYASGSTSPGSANQQVFMFVGGHMANADPAGAVQSFEQQFPGAAVVSAGPLGGKAVCAMKTEGNESLAMCAWFDNNTFGTLASPSMTPTQLANTMSQVRPGIEQIANK